MSLKQRKCEARRIAKQLGYQMVMPDIVERINSATSHNEVNRILVTARHSF